MTETSKLLGISRGLAYEQVRVGILPSIKCGRRILVPKAALMRMLKEAKSEQRFDTRSSKQ
ncbi:MAG: helix-turn-helix domain-containing protein [Promethearchaeota archaeon]